MHSVAERTTRVMGRKGLASKGSQLPQNPKQKTLDPNLLAGSLSGYGSGKIIPDPDKGSSRSEINFEVKLL
jgi:hypothetical protein